MSCLRAGTILLYFWANLAYFGKCQQLSSRYSWKEVSGIAMEAENFLSSGTCWSWAENKCEDIWLNMEVLPLCSAVML
jgi:hypothetical protein